MPLKVLPSITTSGTSLRTGSSSGFPQIPKITIPESTGISKKRLRKMRYCRQRSRKREDLFHLRRLGSGFFFETVSLPLDSAIYAYHVVGLFLYKYFLLSQCRKHTQRKLSLSFHFFLISCERHAYFIIFSR